VTGYLIVVVSLNVPGQSGGGPISGFNQHDRMEMGLLRTVADAVIVGAGTLRAAPQHRWTAAYIYPPLAPAYQQLRTTLGKAASPLNVIVTARGELNLDLPVFQSHEVQVVAVTGMQGEQRIRTHHLISTDDGILRIGALPRATARYALAPRPATSQSRSSDANFRRNAS
jgi:riboflavin biosynthesis pyrimidine reductase